MRPWLGVTVRPNGQAPRRAAAPCPRAFYENDPPVVELNGVTRLATRRLGKKISKILLRLVAFQ
jgi:hypothetical protein